MTALLTIGFLVTEAFWLITTGADAEAVASLRIALTPDTFTPHWEVYDA